MTAHLPELIGDIKVDNFHQYFDPETTGLIQNAQTLEQMLENTHYIFCQTVSARFLQNPDYPPQHLPIDEHIPISDESNVWEPVTL